MTPMTPKNPHRKIRSEKIPFERGIVEVGVDETMIFFPQSRNCQPQGGLVSLVLDFPTNPWFVSNSQAVWIETMGKSKEMMPSKVPLRIRIGL